MGLFCLPFYVYDKQMTPEAVGCSYNTNLLVQNASQVVITQSAHALYNQVSFSFPFSGKTQLRVKKSFLFFFFLKKKGKQRLSKLCNLVYYNVTRRFQGPDWSDEEEKLAGGCEGGGTNRAKLCP